MALANRFSECSTARSGADLSLNYAGKSSPRIKTVRKVAISAKIADPTNALNRIFPKGFESICLLMFTSLYVIRPVGGGVAVPRI